MSEAVGERGGSRRFVTLSLAVLVAAGVVLRLVWLDRLTGIDGDEAWYGVLAQHWAAGDFVTWRTPTGNYPGPIQPALVALGQFVAPARFVMLRVPSLLSSLAAMALAWWIGRRFFDEATARLALLLVALLPANIAYARFGWDPSHGAMLALAAIATAMQRRLAPTALVYALAVWTHPTNVFLAPMLLILFARAEREVGNPPWSLRSLALIALIGAATAAMMAAATQAGQFASPLAMLARLVSPSDWLAFLLSLARLITGRAWFMHLAGNDYGALLPLADGIAVALLAGTLWFAVGTLRGERLSHRGLPAGWLAMLIAYALVGGAGPLNPPTERYAIVLVAPTALVIAMALRAWLGKNVGTLREAALAATLGAALIAATLAFYLVPLATRDRTGFTAWLGVDALRTGPVEPKEATARWLLAQRRTGQSLRVIAEDWWLYWPLAYRLDSQAVVINAETDPRGAGQPGADPTVVVTYAGSTLDRRLAPVARPAFTATGYDGRAIVDVWVR